MKRIATLTRTARDGVKILRLEPGEDSGQPALEAIIQKWGAQHCMISVAEEGGSRLIAQCEVNRGIAFADVVANKILRGCMSRLGHHRRLTANRALRSGQAQPDHHCQGGAQ